MNLFRYVTRFLIEPGISVMLVVVLRLGRMIITVLNLPVTIYFVAVVTHWVVNGLVGTPVSLRIKVLLVLGIMVLRGRGIINRPILMVLVAAS